VAHSLSSKKRIRQNAKHRTLNRARKTVLKSKLRKVQDAHAHGNVAEAESGCVAACQALDRAADQGTIHRNAAARRKSRLARRVNALKSKAAT
jgi:small subunit ribosomal protein S20